MKSLKRIFLFAFCFVTTLVLVSCGTPSTPADVITETEADAIVEAIRSEVALPDGLVVESDIELPTSYEAEPEAIIAWSSSNPSVISNAGLVNRPTFEEGDALVTLTVTITMKYNQNAAGETHYGRVQKVYSFNVTVTAMPYVPTDEEVAEGYLAAVADLSGSYKDDFDLPAVTNGVWSVEGNGIEVADGFIKVTRTAEDQAATLTLTVTVGEYVGTRTFNITVPALVTLHYYNSNNWSTVYVYEWSVDPRVAWPGTKVDVVDGWVHYTPSYDPTGYNYIFTNNAGAQTGDIKYEAGKNYYYGLSGKGFASVEEVMADLEANKTVIYLRGSMNGWGTSTALEEHEGQYTITVDLKANDEFKFATEDWSTVDLGAAAVKKVDSVNFKGSSNIVVVNAGTYKFTLSKTAIISVERIVDEAEEAQKIMDKVSVDSVCNATLALPAYEGLTWSVKEGSAIVITDGVATVTQTAAEQTVVLTATVVYGEVTLTKDFTVTVLPLVPTDEEIAQGYLNAVADLSGEYTTDITLPAVTNGVWSATGLEIVDGVAKVVQTAEIQTATLTITVTVGEVVLTKDFTITIPAMEVVTYETLHYYNSLGWANVYVYEWAVDPLVAWPGTKLEVVDGWAHYTLSHAAAGYNFIFNAGDGNDANKTPDIAYAGKDYFYGKIATGFANEEELKAHLNANKVVVYLRGTMNNWGETHAFVAENDGSLTLTIDLVAGQEFKIATSDWSTINIGASTIKSVDGTNFGGTGDNAVVNTTGTFKFTLVNNKLTKIERIIDEQAEAEKMLAPLSLNETCQDALELPVVEGVVWSVKEGTGIAIVDGVATVTQSDVDQVVVIMATATYGEATATKEFTVTVLALTISDEDLAAAYLAEAGNLASTYKANFTLPAVTNGVWSVVGDGIALNGNSAVVTRTTVDQAAVITITVTVNEVVLTKDFEVTVPLAYFVYYYNTKGWSKVNIYYWPTGGSGAVAWPGAAMTKSTENTKLYYYASDTAFTGHSIIFNNGSSQTGDIVYSGLYYYGECNKGFDTFEAADAHYQANKNVTPLYLRGSMNGWGTATPFEYENGVYTLTITLAKNAEFKISDSGWTGSKTLGASAIKAKDSVNFTGSDNCKVVNAGTYKFTVQNNKLVSVEKVA